MHGTKQKIKHLSRRALSFAEFLLIELIDEIDDFNFSVRYPYATMGRSARLAREYYEDNQREWEAALKKRELRRLKERKLIMIRHEEDRIVAALTEDGKIAALRTIIRNIDKPMADGCRCLVSFDVPETCRRARSLFRRVLKESGFRYLHRSVWMTDRDIIREMDGLIILLKLQKWVEVFCVNKILTKK